MCVIEYSMYNMSVHFLFCHFLITVCEDRNSYIQHYLSIMTQTIEIHCLETPRYTSGKLHLPHFNLTFFFLYCCDLNDIKRSCWDSHKQRLVSAETKQLNEHQTGRRKAFLQCWTFGVCLVLVLFVL